MGMTEAEEIAYWAEDIKRMNETAIKNDSPAYHSVPAAEVRVRDIVLTQYGEGEVTYWSKELDRDGNVTRVRIDARGTRMYLNANDTVQARSGSRFTDRFAN